LSKDITLTAFIRVIADIPNQVMRHCMNGMDGTANGAEHIFRDKINALDLVYKGALAKSIARTQVGFGSKRGYAVGSTVPQGEWMEYGTRPHSPPIDALVPWVEEKLGIEGQDAKLVAFEIQANLQEHGHRPRYWMGGSMAAVEDLYVKNLYHSMVRAERALPIRNTTIRKRR
jgi:hypothetical protein